MSFLAELKRRNVFRVAAAYAVVAWLLAQVADVALDAFGAPDWVPKTVLLLLLLGFVPALLFAWAFELTPEGVRRERDIDRSVSITRETGRKLDRVIIAVLGIAVGFLLVDKFLLQDATNPEDAGLPVAGTGKSVAVLPFVAMSNGNDDAYFADGLTEEILNSLAQLPELLVTARTSAFAFKGQDVPVPEIAQKLGVANVVEGSVRRSGERLRVTAQLIRAADGFHLWSETYERPAADSFGVQDEIAEKVATALDVVLDDERLAKMRSAGLRNPEAFVTYQKAVELFDRAHELGSSETMSMLARVNVMLDGVLALEPGFSQAHVLHADYFVHRVADADEIGPLPDSEAAGYLALAEADYRNAATAAATDAQRLSATLDLALLSQQFGRLPELIEATARSRGCINSSWWPAVTSVLPSTDALLALAKNMQQCDPLSFTGWVKGAEVLISAGDFAGATETALQGLEKIQHLQLAQALADAYIGAGEYDKALAASERLIDRVTVRQAYRVHVAMAQGDTEAVEAGRAAILAKDDVSRYQRSLIYARSGMRDDANELAAAMDAEPLGYLNLLEAAAACYCGAPWDLEATPNLAGMLGEAGMIWPPRAPIRWPLKTW